MRLALKIKQWLFPHFLIRKERDRLERLKSMAYRIQNRMDEKPMHYNMDYSKAELSALCWAIERISGKPFKTESARDL